MKDTLRILPVTNRRQLLQFVKFPWKIYEGDPNWVPPLISDQKAYLDPRQGGYYKRADIALFTAYRGREAVGTIATFIDSQIIESLGRRTGGFGFFETIADYTVAERLLEAACEWLRTRGCVEIRGPTCFNENERPGVLIAGADCPPAMLEAHTPPYYKDFLERYGMEKDCDLFAWRAFRSQVGEELGNIPPELNRVAEAAFKMSGATIRKLRMPEWDNELRTAQFLFNATLKHMPGFVPLSEEDFFRLANPLRLFIDPDLALFAEVDGKAIGFCVAVPDINRVLIHLNGRLFPVGWLKIKRLIRQVEVVTFKLMGVLEEYRHRGIEALLYLEVVKEFYNKGYEWLDGSVTSEFNPMINLIAHRLGAERYKHFRIYKKSLE